MPDYQNATKTNLTEPGELEKYVLYSRGEIISALRDLSKKPDIITAYFDSGSKYLLTAVLGVLPDRGLVVLDHGPDDSLNERVVATDRLVCVTKHDSVTIRFSLDNLQRAKYQAGKAFAAPIPDSLFRLQRREFFRVNTPITNPVTCVVEMAGKSWTLEATDLSAGGLGLIDRTGTFNAEPHQRIDDCLLELGETTLQVDIEIRYTARFRQRDGNEVIRIGCAFGRMPMEKSVTIQRYIHKLQMEQRATSPD